MTIHEEEADMVRRGLRLLDVCSPPDSGSVGYVTHYNRDMSQEHYVKQEYCQSSSSDVENDEMIAQSLQEELSQLEDADEEGSFRLCPDPEETSVPVIEDESILDDEVGRRLNNQMVPVPHVPRTNQEIPSVDEATSDHQRLSERLELYDLVELKVSGDGNCQLFELFDDFVKVNTHSDFKIHNDVWKHHMGGFRSLSDQIYRTFDYHEFVRQQVVDQLKSYPELYEGYVPMGYDEYIRRMSNNGEWGDHVTLQAAADSYGFRIFVITSFKDTCYIEILPRELKSKRMITLSFWAEVHYNSIYPTGELPAPDADAESPPPPKTKRKKKWLWRHVI